MRWTSAVSVAILSLAAGYTATAAESWVGRPLAEALRHAERFGVRVIFTDRLVPPGLLIKRDPVSSDPTEALREILKSHALELEEVAPGVYAITAEPPAHHSAAASRATAPLAQAEITASRYRFDAESLNPSFLLDGGDLDEQPALFNDAAQSIRRFPGTAGHTLSARTFVRGGTADENLYLLDGVPLHKPFHLQTMPVNFSVLDPSVISRVDLYSGVLPLEHDGRMSGLIDMRLSESADAFAGRIAVGVLDTSAAISGQLPNERGNWLLFSRRGLLERASHFIRPLIGEPMMVDSLARVRYRLTDSSDWIVGALAAHDHVDFLAENNAGLTDDKFDRRYAWSAYEKRWEQLTSRTLLAHTAIESQQHGELWDIDSDSSGTLEDRREFRTSFFRSDWTLAIGRGALRWGASAKEERAHIDFFRALSFPEGLASLTGRPSEEALSIATQTSLREYAGYLGVNRALSKRLSFDGGVHWSHGMYSTDQSDAQWSPRLGLLFDLSSATRVRLSVGRMTQRQSADELPLEQNRLLFDDPSTNTIGVLALEHDFGPDIATRIEIFDKHIDRPQPRLENVFSPDALLPQLRPDAIVIAPTSSQTRGVDLYATAKVTESLRGWLSYSYSRALDEIDSVSVARAWDQPHALSTGASFNRGGWLISGLLSVHSSWPLTPLNNSERPRTLGVDPPEGQTVGARSSVRPGYYYTLDLKAAWRVELRPGAWTLALNLSNATNRKNTCCDEIYSMDVNIINPNIQKWTTRQHWQPFYPYASIAWEF